MNTWAKERGREKEIEIGELPKQTKVGKVAIVIIFLSPPFSSLDPEGKIGFSVDELHGEKLDWELSNFLRRWNHNDHELFMKCPKATTCSPMRTYLQTLESYSNLRGLLY